jgi:hypothetical protein
MSEKARYHEFSSLISNLRNFGGESIPTDTLISQALDDYLKLHLFVCNLGPGLENDEFQNLSGSQCFPLLISTILKLDYYTKNDIGTTLKIWKGLIQLLKCFRDIPLGEILVNDLVLTLISYVRGGVQSLLKMTETILYEDSVKYSSAIEISNFFLQRMGVVMVYYKSSLEIEILQTCMKWIFAMRGALHTVYSIAIIDEGFQHHLNSISSNNAYVRAIEHAFCRLLMRGGEEERDEGINYEELSWCKLVSFGAESNIVLDATAAKGCCLLWVAAVESLSNYKDASISSSKICKSSHLHSIAITALTNLLNSLQRLSLQYTSFVSDDTMMSICVQVSISYSRFFDLILSEKSFLFEVIM